MAVDTDIEALVTTEDMVDMVMDTEAMAMVVTTTARDPLIPNQKLMPDICMVDTVMEDMEVMVMVLMAVDTDIAALDTTEDMVDMVMVLDTEDMAVSGDKHSQAFHMQECQLVIICLMSSHPLIRNQCRTFVESR